MFTFHIDTTILQTYCSLWLIKRQHILCGSSSKDVPYADAPPSSAPGPTVARPPVPQLWTTLTTVSQFPLDCSPQTKGGYQRVDQSRYSKSCSWDSLFDTAKGPPFQICHGCIVVFDILPYQSWILKQKTGNYYRKLNRWKHFFLTCHIAHNHWYVIHF